MWASVLRILGYILGIIGGVSLIWAVILRLSSGPAGTTLAGLTASSIAEFSQICLIFSIAFGVGAIFEVISKKKT